MPRKIRTQMSQEEREALFASSPTERPPVENITITFGDFMKGNKDGGHNLYIIWRNNQALYIGISTRGAWSRWFSGWSSHMGRNVFGKWYGCSPIGEEVVRNLPDSLQWGVELRYYDTWYLDNEERKLIRELCPLLNDTHN
jgi:hypothetical protein